MASINLLEELYKAQQQVQESPVDYCQNNNDELKQVLYSTRKYLADYHTNAFSESILDKNNRPRVIEIIREYVANQLMSAPGMDLEQLISYLEKEICGFGPLESLLNDDAVSEIMINNINEIFVERSGKIYPSTVKFESEEQLINIIRKILAPIGRNLDLAEPYVDARLPGGSRINAIISPIALNGTTVTIRKFARVDFSEQKLIDKGTLTKEMVQFIKLLVRGRANVLVVGGTGSGKTSMLKFLCSFIPSDERLITIEDIEELRLKNGKDNLHTISLEARRSKENPITIYDLLVNSLRMRPDRIIVGEVRGKEALEMLEAMNTGHEGSLSTLHANGPTEGLKRLGLMILRNGFEIEAQVINEIIGDTIDLVLFMKRMPEDGSRKLVQISEVITYQSGKMVVRDIFRFKRLGIRDSEVIGNYDFCNPISPALNEKLMSWGISELELKGFVNNHRRTEHGAS